MTVRVLEVACFGPRGGTRVAPFIRVVILLAVLWSLHEENRVVLIKLKLTILNHELFATFEHRAHP